MNFSSDNLDLAQRQEQLNYLNSHISESRNKVLTNILNDIIGPDHSPNDLELLIHIPSDYEGIEMLRWKGEDIGYLETEIQIESFGSGAKVEFKPLPAYLEFKAARPSP